MPGSATPTLAGHVGNHGYSVGYELTGGGFTGVGATRNDSIITGIPQTGCAYRPFEGNPVYQTMWVHNGSGNWIELGTGHQCGGTYVYHFGGIGVNGNWIEKFVESNVPVNVSHDFRISRTADNRIRWWVDDQLRFEFATTFGSFPMVEVGLETYTSNASVYYGNFALTYQKGGGQPFFSWAGRDDDVKIGAHMCGKWTSDTTYRAGMNAC